MASIAFEIIPTPVDEVPDESKIRDVKDRPILRAAQLANVDILLTGDKDFLQKVHEKSTLDFSKVLHPNLK